MKTNCQMTFHNLYSKICPKSNFTSLSGVVLENMKNWFLRNRRRGLRDRLLFNTSSLAGQTGHRLSVARHCLHIAFCLGKFFFRTSFSKICHFRHSAVRLFCFRSGYLFTITKRHLARNLIMSAARLNYFLKKSNPLLKEKPLISALCAADRTESIYKRS